MGRIWLAVAVMVSVVGASIGAATAERVHRCDGSVADIVGTRGKDNIRGTDQDDVIVGLGGDDVISGLNGDDVLCGGKGSDRLFFYVHDSRSACQTPSDDYYYDDLLLGGRGADKLFGDGYLVFMIGGRGNDVLDGCSRIDLVYAIYSQNPVTVKLDKGFARGEGYDTLRNINVVLGSPYADVIVGSNYTEKIFDRSYSELLIGGGGNDKVRGRQGPDRLEGSTGDDALVGSDGVAGNDQLAGGDGSDSCTHDPDDLVETCES